MVSLSSIIRGPLLDPGRASPRQVDRAKRGGPGRWPPRQRTQGRSGSCLPGCARAGALSRVQALIFVQCRRRCHRLRRGHERGRRSAVPRGPLTRPSRAPEASRDTIQYLLDSGRTCHAFAGAVGRELADFKPVAQLQRPPMRSRGAGDRWSLPIVNGSCCQPNPDNTTSATKWGFSRRQGARPGPGRPGPDGRRRSSRPRSSGRTCDRRCHRERTRSRSRTRRSPAARW